MGDDKRTRNFKGALRMGEEKGTSQERQGRGCWRGRDGRGWSRSPGAKNVQLEL